MNSILTSSLEDGFVTSDGFELTGLIQRRFLNLAIDAELLNDSFNLGVVNKRKEVYLSKSPTR